MKTINNIIDNINWSQQCINYMETNLYRNGLTLYYNRSNYKSKIYKKSLIISAYMLAIIQAIVSLIVNDRGISLMIGDIGYNWN